MDNTKNRLECMKILPPSYTTKIKIRLAKSARRKKGAEERRQFVAHAAERGEFFLVGAASGSRIPDAPMDSLAAGEDRTFFGGGITDGDDRVEVLTLELR